MRHLSLVFQVAAGVAAAGICAVGILLMFRLPTMEGTLLQKVLMLVVAVCFPTAAVCWWAKVRIRRQMWLSTGAWPPQAETRSQQWGRRALRSWLCGMASLGLLTLSFVMR